MQERSKGRGQRGRHKPAAGERQWRCRSCGKLLGVLRDGRLHIEHARGHQYLVGFPATTVCRSCKTLNELRDEGSVSANDAGGES